MSEGGKRMTMSEGHLYVGVPSRRYVFGSFYTAHPSGTVGEPVTLLQYPPPPQVDLLNLPE